MPLGNYLESIADDLRDPEFVREYLRLGWTDGMPTFLISLRDVATVNLGMTRLAEITGMSRESLYKTLSATGNPRLETIRTILRALGYDLALDNNFAVSRGDQSTSDSENESVAAV